MFCSKCGKQIEDNIKFCPYCGNKIINSNMDSITDTVKKVADTAKSTGKAIKESTNGKIDSEAVKDTVKKATDTAVNLAQSAKNAANEATNGQAEKYAEKVKETAQNFADDVKQVAKDKDTSNFFTKNKYRNVKIIAILLIAVFLIGKIFGGGSLNFRENMAKEYAVMTVRDSLSVSDTAKFSHIKVIDKFKTDSGDVYIVTMTCKAESKLGQTQKVNCALIIALSNNVTKTNYKKGNISDKDAVASTIFTYTDSEKKESIKKLKEAASNFK